MSSYIMAKVDENGVRPVEQLEEMYQVCFSYSSCLHVHHVDYLVL